MTTVACEFIGVFVPIDIWLVFLEPRKAEDKINVSKGERISGNSFGRQSVEFHVECNDSIDTNFLVIGNKNCARGDSCDF